MTNRPSRRDVLAVCATAAASASMLPNLLLEETVSAQPKQAQSQPRNPRSANEPFGYCFNTSTIRGQRLPLTQVIDITAKAGWDGIEPWIDEITHYMQGGGKLAELRKRISDAGLSVPSAIGFAEWVVDDPEKRRKGMEHAKRDMDLVAQIGGTRVAAPAAGAKDVKVELHAAAERYRDLCELGRQMGVVPQLEVWGFSKTFQRLGEAAFVAVESGHPDACILADPYHVYKGGSSIESVRLFSAKCLQHFHMNDYPADPPRETIADEHRVYPGDGVAPLTQLFRELRDVGYAGMLSLELFSKVLWAQDPLEVAKAGLAKTKAAVRKAFV
jgi:sugar phosphate isomerase/epimerase